MNYKVLNFVSTTLRNQNLMLASFVQILVDAPLEHMEARFPLTDLLFRFSLLAMRPIRFLSEAELAELGKQEIQTQCSHYGQDQTATWGADGKDHQSASPAGIDAEQALKEWDILKKVVACRTLPQRFHLEIVEPHCAVSQERFPNLVTLAQLGLTSALHTAGCERGFSVQNRILTSQSWGGNPEQNDEGESGTQQRPVQLQQGNDSVEEKRKEGCTK